MLDPSGVQSSQPLCHICRQPKCHTRSEGEGRDKEVVARSEPEPTGRSCSCVLRITA
jgi:hypothetical protein